jgi:Holliday junction resolvase-like predicted endonuclease
MEISRKYFAKYLHDIAIEQIADSYLSQGYKVSKDEKIGSYEADLVARRGNEHIVVEVKTGAMSEEKKRRIAAIADYVRSVGGYKLLVAIATTLKQKKLAIDNIEQLLFSYLREHLPANVAALSTHTVPLGVSDVDIDEVTVNGDSILVKGTGVVTLAMQNGSDAEPREEETTIEDNFSFDFDIELKSNHEKSLAIANVSALKVDTSSYWGN